MLPLALLLAAPATAWRTGSTRAAAPAAAPISVVESGASGLEWAPRPAQAWAPGASPSAATTISLDRAAVRQEVLGFGSCFTDTSAYNAMVFMEPALRESFVEALWGQSGLRSSVMRMHINSPDYAVHSYNYDNVTDDFALAHFDRSLAYDAQRVIPLIRLAAAKAASWGGPPLRLFASPWSPPGWMKTNNNMINSAAVCLKEDAAAGSYKQAWADYILAWLQSFEAAGVSIWGLTPQNEPGARQANFESCAYDVPHYVDFVGAYLGPTVLPRFPALKIMAYDHNKLASLEYAEGVASNANASAAVHGTAIHWYDYTQSLGLENLDAIHALDATKFILATEACFLESLTFNWQDTGFLYAADIIGDLRHHVVGWTAWNSVLLAGDKYPESYGGPNHDNTTHFGDGVLFEFNATGSQRLILQSSYWVRPLAPKGTRRIPKPVFLTRPPSRPHPQIQGHFSRAMRPGSFVVNTAGFTADTYADFEAIRNRTVACRGRDCGDAAGFPLMSVGFADPAAQEAGVVVANVNAQPVDFVLEDAQGGRHSACSIPAHSIQTYTFSTI